jgi:Tfp pilus assembly protein PilN
MLHLNLIAEETKQTIKYQRLYLLFLKAEVTLVVLALIVGVIIFSAEKMLSANIYKSSQETAQIINTSSADYNLKARELNEKIATVAQIEGSFVSYSKVLRNIITLMPDNVSLSYLDINSDAKTIKIRGLAPTRENLLDLEKNLKNAPWLSKVDIPLQYKILKSNINFDIPLEFDATKLP